MSTDPAAPETLLSNAYLLVVRDRAARVVRLTRSARVMPDVATLRATFEALFAALDRLPRSDYSLFVDLRAAIGRVDDEFEAAMHEMRPRLMSGFRRTATLVRSAVGKLQVQRLSRADGLTDHFVTSDEGEALAHVRGA